MILNYKKEQKTKVIAEHSNHKWVKKVKLLHQRDKNNSTSGFIYTYQIDFLYIDNDGNEYNKLNQRILDRHYKDFISKNKSIG